MTVFWGFVAFKPKLLFWGNVLSRTDESGKSYLETNKYKNEKR